MYCIRLLEPTIQLFSLMVYPQTLIIIVCSCLQWLDLHDAMLDIVNLLKMKLVENGTCC
jgi:hypothetical protein